MNAIHKGDRVIITPFGVDGSDVHTRVLVTTFQVYICEGSAPQTNFSKWVQDACQRAGVPPDQKICIGRREDTHHAEERVASY